MTIDDRFAVFILTHGRPDNVQTYHMLKRQGYTGEIYLIVDNEDKTVPRYREVYGDAVIEFDKAAIAAQFDECDNFNIPRKSVVYARNASFDIARSLGVRYFLQLDDDYKDWQYRFNSELRLCTVDCQNLDRLFEIALEYYKSIPALTIAFSQGGDLIGGHKGRWMRQFTLKRKAMNTFFCSVDRLFKFVGRINEDVNAYTTLGNRGEIMFTMYNATVIPTQTQKQEGGMSDLYLDHGTYVKSFYAVMNAPSFVHVYMLRTDHARIHHRVTWNNAVPVFLHEKYRKIDGG